MNRRDFVKFLGVSSASLPIANALAKIPEVEPQIILLDKPKDIIIANSIPNVDFVVEHLLNINYHNDENVSMYETVTTPYLTNPTVGALQVDLQLEYALLNNDINLFKRMIDPRTFTFNLKNTIRGHLAELNGRRFMLTEYNILLSNENITTVQAHAVELFS